MNTTLTAVTVEPPRATFTSKTTGLRAWELDQGLVIRERRNSSGSISYRLEVPAKLAGQRQLLQFKTWSEANDHAAKVAADREHYGLSAFNLTKQQMDDAARALQILRPFSGVTLDMVAAYYVRFEKPQKEATLNELREVYLREKELGLASKVGALRSRSMEDLKSRLGLFCKVHGETPVKAIRPDIIHRYLFAEQIKNAATRRNHYRVLRGFFNYAVKEGYTAENPVLAVRIPRPEDPTPGILTVLQCEALLTAALNNPDWGLLPYVALGLFCGVRTEELSKMNFRWVNTKTGLVTIPREIAKKRRIRCFTMPDCCRAWLMAAGVKEGQEGPIRPERYREAWRRLLKASGVQWSHNCMRHSAASYHFQRYQDAAKTISILGQRSDDVLFTHYRALVDPSEAEKFYQLLPPAPAANVVPLPAAAVAC